MRLSRKLWILIFTFCFTQNSYGSCTFSESAPIYFGAYNPFRETPTDTTSILKVSCTGQANNYQIELNAGHSGNVLSRKMYQGHYSLNYNLYINPTRTLIWGDGTNGTTTIAGNSNKLSTSEQIIYGRIPPHQTNAVVGNYADTLVVTLSY